jgi:hypothetical protein
MGDKDARRGRSIYVETNCVECNNFERDGAHNERRDTKADCALHAVRTPIRRVARVFIRS